MAELLNIRALHRKMKTKPVGQRLHLFFNGATKLLTAKQIAEVEAAVKEDHKQTLEFLKVAKKSA